ncbi:MAG: S-layer homology domain-containing protein [Peptostreptococcaceae bacterium]|nr:S-layer homology domain-containing protein [Peptostreptococcaceae bacterium]
MRKLTNCIRKSVATVTIICMLFTIAPVNAYALSVSDIAGHWAMDTIQNWIDQGAVKGYEDGTFRPEDSISRAEFMSLVNGAFGYTATSNTVYTDVETDAWYANAVGKASTAGYITGYPDGTIRPDSPISREEAASILAKIDQLGVDVAAAGVFTDLAANNWSKGAIGAVYLAEIMTGYPDGSFKGQNDIKRGEALVALDKAAMMKEYVSVETQTAGNYTALGDSIAYGSKVAKGFGYVDLFANALKNKAGNEQLAVFNLGKPGKNSSELLADLKHDETTINAVSKAKIITISIGGNNLLRPVTTDMAEAFKLDSKSDTFIRDLTLVLMSKANRDKLKIILAEVSPELEIGVQQFAKDWPEIIKTVKALSPQAEITVMTVYNPIREGDAYFKTFNKPVSGINDVINSGSGAYKVDDVYSAFNNYTGTEALTNFDLLKGSLDVHPTLRGYEEIYKCHII